jgi:serine-type D-Ala-D-Ala carboxypeptidase/endopeptidase
MRGELERRLEALGRRGRRAVVAAVIRGEEYEDLLAARVLRPLGMGATAVGVPPALREQLVHGHSRRGEPRAPIEDFMPAAGSLRSNAEDMLRFLEACLHPPSERPGPALALAQRPHAGIGRHAAAGLGWMIAAPRNGPRIVWHNGGTWGFRSFAGFNSGAGKAAVVLSNTARSVDRLGFELVGES